MASKWRSKRFNQRRKKKIQALNPKAVSQCIWPTPPTKATIEEIYKGALEVGCAEIPCSIAI